MHIWQIKVLKCIKQNPAIIIMLFISVLLIVFTYNDSFLYNDDIVRVEKSEIISCTSDTDIYDNTEKQYIQVIMARKMNGSDKGTIVNFENTYNQSCVLKSEYRNGDFLFVSGNEQNEIKIIGEKRDFLLVAFFCAFALVLLVIGRKKGIFTLLALILNVIVTLCVVFLYTKGANLLLMCSLATLIFIVLTTFLINGINKKTFASVISTVLGMLLCCGITFAVMVLTKFNGIYLEQMEFVLKDPVQLFLIQLIVGNLGGIMDICVSMSSTIHEMIRINPGASYKCIKKSAEDISSDIMGTMTTTILLAYLAGGMPVFLICIKNGYSLSYIFENSFNIELIRALTGCIGMVISIPVSILVSMMMFKGEREK